MRLREPDVLRGMAILFVVAVHAFAYLGVPTGGAWAAVWFVIHQTAVPAFFLADGWLHGKRWRGAMTGAEQTEYLEASALRLLPPWAVFSVVYLGFRLVSEAAGTAGGAAVLPDGAGGLALALWRGAAAQQLYFLPALMLVRLVTPPLHRLAAGSPVRAATLAVALLVVWRIGVEWRLPVPAAGVDPLLAAMTGLCFAALGWALAEAPDRLELPAAVVPAVLFALAGAALDGRAAATGAQTSAVLALWSLAVATPARIAPPWRWIGRRSMEIYLLHAPIMIKLVCAAIIAAKLPAWLGLPVAVAAATAGALAAASVLGRLGLRWLWTPRPSRFPPAPARVSSEPRTRL